MHNGYGYFTMSELFPWVVEKRRYTYADRSALRAALRSGKRDEEREKEAFRVGGSHDPTATAFARRDGPEPWSPVDLGPVEVSCERGVIRNARYGLTVYGEDGPRELDLTHLQRPEPDPSGGLSIAILEELYGAVRMGRRAYHDGAWGRATLEATLAVIASAHERREIVLQRQVPMPLEYDRELAVL
jgi:phthalate 4,5-cis-dihydrodiol dehydrogenase